MGPRAVDCGAPANGDSGLAVPYRQLASLLWSNHYYDGNIADTGRRPLVLSRNGGLGSQRYPIGFSGDTHQAFPTLAYQIRATPTAANVLFGWWSHDIGGFHSAGVPGDADPSNAVGSELLLRWIQFGALSPIFRTHCQQCERRIWKFPYYQQMKEAMVLRNNLGPYLYTAARNAFDTGVALVHPMYYDSPHEEAAYVHKQQYMLGDDILASPISEPVNRNASTISSNNDRGSGSNASQFKATKTTWIPTGRWVPWAAAAAVTSTSTAQQPAESGGVPVVTGPVLHTAQVRKRVFDAPIYTKNRIFAKTSSGQTWKTQIKDSFSRSTGLGRFQCLFGRVLSSR